MLHRNIVSRYSLVLLLSLFAIGVSQATTWKALPKKAPAPSNNPTTQAKIELGKMLFFDPRFSETGTVSCNSCHNLMEGGDDSRATSMGVHGKTGSRNAPTVWNAAFHSVQFWDGRAKNLEAQAKGPVVNPIEMGMKNLEAAMQRLRAIPGYKPYFQKAFGKQTPIITADNAARAVAAFERTLITPNSAYDLYVRGKKSAMNAQQLRGMKTFASTGCTSCHSGPAFNGPSMPEGEGFYARFPTFADNKYVAKYAFMKDMGRFAATKKPADKHMYRVQTLRNITDTAPYFHNGAVNDLHQAVRIMAKTQLNKTLSKNDVNDIVAFFGALGGAYPKMTLPRLPATSGRSVVK